MSISGGQGLMNECAGAIEGCMAGSFRGTLLQKQMGEGTVIPEKITDAAVQRFPILT